MISQAQAPVTEQPDPTANITPAVADLRQSLYGAAGGALIDELRYIASKPGETLELGPITFTGLGNNLFSTRCGEEERVYELAGVQL